MILWLTNFGLKFQSLFVLESFMVYLLDLYVKINQQNKFNGFLKIGFGNLTQVDLHCELLDIEINFNIISNA